MVNDDALRISSTVTTNSTSLETFSEAPLPVLVGLRYQGPKYSKGATITSAFVRFYVMLINVGATALTLRWRISG